MALAKSKITGLPIRVIRGSAHKSEFSPDFGYKYDGLYQVEDYWQERGKAGFYIWRYRLVKIPEERSSTTSRVTESRASYTTLPPPRIATTILRIIRDTETARRLKKLYDYQCQVCGIRLEGSAGPYVEAAHIRPLGAPHNGSDSMDNLLCLCPNHHVLFDYGAFSIEDDLSLIGIRGDLEIDNKHKISSENLKYHREHYFPHPDTL